MMARHMVDCFAVVGEVYCFEEGKRNTGHHQALQRLVLRDCQHAR